MIDTQPFDTWEENCKVGSILALPATGNSTVLTIASGPILLLGLYAEVTTAIQNQVCTLKFTSVDTASSTAIDLAIATLITAAAAGTWITLPLAFASSLLVTAGGTGPTLLSGNGILIPAGIIRMTTSATNTGNLRICFRYKNLSPLSTVTAA